MNDMPEMIDMKPQEVRVAVLMGGPSSEREISLKSGRSVSLALGSKGYSVVEIDPDQDLKKKITEAHVHAAFIALHGRFGEDGTVQKMLDTWNIPYTGSSPEASFLALRKDLAKTEFDRLNILTPRWSRGPFGRFDNLRDAVEKLGFPVVLKPVDEGSSIGLEMVRSQSELRSAFERICIHSADFIAEQYIQGRELTVGILDGQTLPIVEIKTTRPFYDFSAKYSAGYTEYEVPAVMDSKSSQKIQEYAFRAHCILGCRDFSRVDILLDSDQHPWVLEVNTIPGFTERSLLPKAAAAIGISFQDLCERILKMCLARGQHVKA